MDNNEFEPKRTFSAKKQVRNRHSSAGITNREAETLKRCAKKIFKISQKTNLYIGYENRLLTINDLLYELLQQADRA
jgi:hypothetical protein